MSNADGIKPVFKRIGEAVATRVIAKIVLAILVFVLTILALAVVLLYKWEDFWWATGMFLSLMTNVFVIQWANGQAEKVASTNTFIEHLKSQLENAQNDASSKLYLKGELIEQTIQERREVCQLWSQLRSATKETEETEATTGTGLRYVNMADCDERRVREEDVAVISLGYSNRPYFSEDNSAVRRFAVRKKEASKLCNQLAGILRVSLEPYPEVEISDDDIPF